ncbi:MAG: hypothetical protein WHU95_00390 [candidate division WOR-3 bacterium]|nr:hypothetical protein [candidate division WOR-3 bacterium]MDH7518144.1 hypothetical protein [bacterium]
MRRVGILIVLAAVVVVGGFLLLRKPQKSTGKRTKSKTAQSDSTQVAGQQSGTAAVRGAKGKTVGRLKAKTKEERLAEKKRLREEEKKKRRELKRQERERRRMLKYARSKRGSRKASRKGSYYVVKAIVSLGSESYALIDSRRVKVGDVVMGRRIVDIQPDRIEIEAFGRRSVVRVGESILPTSYIIERKRRI